MPAKWVNTDSSASTVAVLMRNKKLREAKLASAGNINISVLVPLAQGIGVLLLGEYFIIVIRTSIIYGTPSFSGVNQSLHYYF
jgi:hypothetical protein